MPPSRRTRRTRRRTRKSSLALRVKPGRQRKKFWSLLSLLSLAVSAFAATNTVSELPKLEVAHAVMVTVELDFGARVPTIAEALREVERRHQPDDGAGRVFAVLDAYGEPTPDRKKLHVSMHVSAEKPGVGSLVFKRTGEVL